MRSFRRFGTVYIITSIQIKSSNIQKERFFLFRIHPYLEWIRRDVGKLISEFWWCPIHNRVSVISAKNVFLLFSYWLWISHFWHQSFFAKKLTRKINKFDWFIALEGLHGSFCKMFLSPGFHSICNGRKSGSVFFFRLIIDFCAK